MQIQYPKFNQVVVLLVLILILTVGYKNLFSIHVKIIIASFSSLDATHGPPSANITHRHVGDLGNLTTDADGNIEVDMEDSIIELYNATRSILNRAVVIHLARDDGGQGGFNDSATTGYDFYACRSDFICCLNRNAGLRIVCGLVKLSAIVTTTTVPTTSTLRPSTSTPVTTTPVQSTTTPAAGLSIQPAVFIIVITMIIGYTIRY